MTDTKTQIATPQQTWLATIDEETDVLAILDSKSIGSESIPVIKAKVYTEKDEKWNKTSRVGIERKQWDAKKEITEDLEVRVIMCTTNYQLSIKDGDNFSISESTSESYPMRPDVIGFDWKNKYYYNIESQEAFRDKHPTKELLKWQDLKKYIIVYMDTKYGLCKMYLKPSQYAWAYIEKTWYRYNDPIEHTLRYVEKQIPVWLYNKTFVLKANSYEKNDIAIAYPEFTNQKDDPITNEYARPLVSSIISKIKSAEKNILENEEWSNGEKPF